MRAHPGAVLKIPLLFPFGVALAAVAPAACDPIAVPRRCGEIPQGGCPIGRGGTCRDAACHALYDCVDGAWTAVARCDGRDATGQGTGADQDRECEVVALDHAGEAQGCTPALQLPDCPAEAAETCADAACRTGCVDFFVCTEGGWSAVAYCDEQGRLAAVP